MDTYGSIRRKKKAPVEFHPQQTTSSSKAGAVPRGRLEQLEAETWSHHPRSTTFQLVLSHLITPHNQHPKRHSDTPAMLEYAAPEARHVVPGAVAGACTGSFEAYLSTNVQNHKIRKYI